MLIAHSSAFALFSAIVACVRLLGFGSHEFDDESCGGFRVVARPAQPLSTSTARSGVASVVFTGLT